MTTTSRFKPIACASHWGNGNEETPIVRIHAGRPRLGVAVSYHEIPGLIAKLERLYRDYLEVDDYTERLIANK